MGGGQILPSVSSYMSEYKYNDPLNIEPDGTYITRSQMQFFLNRKDGAEKFKSGDPEFVEYYNLCRVYNLVSEIMEEDEDAAIMYWDDKKGIVSMGFPTHGIVEKALAGVDPLVIDIHDDDESFGWGTDL